MTRTQNRVSLAVLLLAAGALPAFSATVSGSIDANSPTMSQTALISTPNCTGAYVAFVVHYDIHPFTVAADGSYNFSVTNDGDESAIYVYNGTPNPDFPADNCFGASNTNPISLDLALTAGSQYWVAIIEDTFAQDGMDYTLTVTGPGAVTIGLPSLVSIPALSGRALALLAGLLAVAGLWAVRRFSA